jgi:S-layer protein
MSVTTAQAISLLENVLFESATAAKANAAGWVSLSNLNSSYSTVAGLATAMSQTAEATIAEQVIRYYEGALGRAPSGAEVAYYVNIVENGNAATGIPAMTTAQINTGATAVPAGTWDKIASFFAASPEFAFASAGGNVVNLLYLNILGRTPNAAEVTYYQNLLAAGTTVSTLVQYFTTSPEYQTKVDAQIQTGLSTYGTTVANGGTAPASVVTITTGGTTNATVYNLTTSVDTIKATGSANTINGVIGSTKASTLTTLDSITGSGTTTLNISATAAIAALPAVSVSGVQTVNITAAAKFVGDVSSWTGVQSLNIKDLSKVDTITITEAATSVSVTDTGGTKAVSVTDGSSKGNVTTSLALTGFSKLAATTTTTDALATVSLTSIGQGSLAIDNVQTKAGAAGTLTLNVAAAGTAATVTVNDSKAAYSAISINAASGKNNLTLTGSSKATSVAETGAGKLTLSIAGDAALTKVTLSGSGNVTISDATTAALKSVDASASSGNNSITITGTGATVKGGSGNDTVTVTKSVGVAIDGGTGTNTIALGATKLDLSTVTKTSMANATNFQNLEFSGTLVDGKTLTVTNLPSTFTGIVLNAAATASAAGITITKAAATTTLTILADAKDAVTFNQATAGAMTLTIGSTSATNGVAFTTKNLVADAVTSVNIASETSGTGTAAVANQLHGHFAAATSLVITGNDGLNLTGSTLTKVASIDASGLTTTGATVLTVTTSVTTGVTFKLGNASATITGSAGATKYIDTYTGGNGVVNITETHGSNSITLGDGKADTLSLGDGNNTVVLGNGATDSVTVSSGNNTITVGNGAKDNIVITGNGNNVITVGTGAADTIHIGGTGSNTVTLGAGAGDTVFFTKAGSGSGVFTSIAGAVAGDIIDVSGVHAIANAGTTLGASLSSAVSDYQTFLNDAVASKAAGTVSWFQFGGNTFIVEEVATTGSFVAGTDLVVQLTGLHDLSKSAFTAAHVVI